MKIKQTRSRGVGGGCWDGEVILLGLDGAGAGGARWACEIDTVDLCDGWAAMGIRDEPDAARRRRCRRTKR